ncbi:unnamed protein product [Heterobilharzia americana]|nr:unnamed protein product [Heterobilharzia americana]
MVCSFLRRIPIVSLVRFESIEGKSEVTAKDIILSPSPSINSVCQLVECPFPLKRCFSFLHRSFNRLNKGVPGSETIDCIRV